MRIVNALGQVKQAQTLNGTTAGGALTGTYPNPSIGSGAIISGMIQSGLTTQLAPLFGYIGGLVTSYTSGSAAGTSGNIGITLGQCTDSSGMAVLTLASGLTKTFASGIIWSSGTNNSAWDAVYPLAGLRVNTLHVYAISDGNITDVLLHSQCSGLAPTMPAGMIYYRRIASVQTDTSGVVYPYYQHGDRFIYRQTRPDVNAQGFAASVDTLINITVPRGINVTAIVNVAVDAAINTNLWISEPAADGGLGTGQVVCRNQQNAVRDFQGYVEVGASVSGQLRMNINQSGVADCATVGYLDIRGRDDGN